MTAHGIHKTFSHEPAVGAVRIAFDSDCVGFHLGDNQMRTAGFERSLYGGGQRFFASNGRGVGDARALGDLFQIGFACDVNRRPYGVLVSENDPFGPDFGNECGRRLDVSAMDVAVRERPPWTSVYGGTVRPAAVAT